MLSSSDWVMLDDASRVLAIACMLIASRNEGKVPNNPDYIKRVAYLNKLPKFKPLIDCGFLENLQADASESKQMIADACPETYREETETYREETESILSDFNSFWDLYGFKVGRAKSELSYRNAIKKGVRHGDIIRGVEKYQSICRSKGLAAKYIKHPTTWLNGEHWNDEYPEIPANDQRTGKAQQAREALVRGLITPARY